VHGGENGIHHLARGRLVHRLGDRAEHDPPAAQVGEERVVVEAVAREAGEL
jgi:hypothetical protein